jgi:hypothetical protein
LRPSQKRNGLYAVPAIGIVRRSVVPTPFASGVPSWNSRSGTWHVAHETLPFALRRASKKRRSPNCAARGSSATRFVGSAGSGSSSDSDRLRSVSTSSRDHPSRRVAATVVSVTASRATAAMAMLFRLMITPAG